MTFWVTLILIIFVQSETSAVDYCDNNMKCNGIENSGCDCSFGSKCKAPKEHKPTLDVRKAVVDAHNKYRDKIASGEETRGGMSKGATEMYVLQYDDGLEYTATCWNKKCTFGHDKCRVTTTFRPVGQNLYFSFGKACDWEYNLEEATRLWYEEVKDMTPGCFKSYGNGCITSKVGHFSQMVWAKTTHVGCSLIEYAGTSCQIACNYGPAGNFQSEPVLQMGTGAEKCKYKSLRFKSLCLLSIDQHELDIQITPPTKDSKHSHSVSINRNNDVVVGSVCIFVWFVKLSSHVSYL